MTDSFDPVRVVARLLPEFDLDGVQISRLSGGLLNEVWRVSGQGGSVVVKHTTPFIASSPDVPLSVSRMSFAATALEWGEANPSLNAFDGVGLPRVLAVSPRDRCIVFEDLGDGPDLREALTSDGFTESDVESTCAAWGHALGAWLGALHVQSWQDPDLQQTMRNQEIQHTRLEVQYRGFEQWAPPDMLRKYPRSAALAADLGVRLWRTPGTCLIMGDLWPPSVLVRGQRLVVIDWEMSHFGQPGQDIGHVLAHLRLIHAMYPAHQARVDALATAFVSAYQDAYRRRPYSWSASMVDDATRHMGLEMLTRVIGPFRFGYGWPESPSASQQAVTQLAWEMVAHAERDLWLRSF